MKSIIERLYKRLEELKREMEEITIAIKTIQHTCPHKENQGMGFHPYEKVEHIKCMDCGKEDTRDV